MVSLKKNAGRPKQSKKKTSSSKLANKHLNKLAKQGKLNRENNRRKRKEKLALKTKSDEANKQREITRSKKSVEEELPLGDDDINYYGTPGQNLSFVSSVQKSVLSQSSSSKKSKKRKIDDTYTEEEYEQLPRKLFAADSNKNMKMILPIKTKKGIVPRVIENEDEEPPEENGEPEDRSPASTKTEEPVGEPESLPVLSSVEMYARRQQKLQERKQRIALLSSSVIENTEGNTKKLRELVLMLHERDADVFVTVRKFVMVSLMEVFKDIVPGYHIRLPTEKEQQQRMKQDTIVLLAHEESLLKSYKEYLEFLERTAKGTRPTDNQKHGRKTKEQIQVPQKAQQGLTELSVRCMCSMLSSHPHFNYCNNIITVLVPYMNNISPEVSDPVCECVKQLFRDDKSGEITLELTRCISRMVKAREFRVQPKVLETFQSLRIKEVSYTDPVEKREKDKKKQHNEKMSRRERKRNKHMVLLEKELQETKATEDKRRRLKLHTETIQSVFLTYFRILKKATNSVLLPVVLEGLAKFAHLINVDFFDDLFNVFTELIESGDLSYRESLHCVQTSFTILSGQGSALNIDLHMFYKHLYSSLFHVHIGTTSDDVPLVLECLDLMVSKRKRQVSQQRILAFLKRLSTLTLQQTPAGSLGLLAAIRTFIMTYSYTDILFDNEAQGSGVYLPEIEDPEHCNAHNATVWELPYLKIHYHPVVRKYSSHIIRGAPVTGEGQLSVDLRKPAAALLKEFSNEDPFSIQIPAHANKKVKRRVSPNFWIQPSFKDDVLAVLKSVEDTPPTFDVTS